jgi:hypothetical protein
MIQWPMGCIVTSNLRNRHGMRATGIGISVNYLNKNMNAALYSGRDKIGAFEMWFSHMGNLAWRYG